jgi:hypothetical protein
MKEHRFEIVRRGSDRFGWIFVAIDGDRRRVRASSVRDYRSIDKVTEAIDRMQGAEIVDTTEGDPDLFPLPPTLFQIVPGVVPLLVQESSTGVDPRLLQPTPRAVASGGRAGLAVAEPEPEAPAEPEAAAKPKTAAKRPATSRARTRRSTRKSSS